MPTTPIGPGITGILGKIFGGAGGQDSLLGSLLTSGLAAGAGAGLNTPQTTTYKSNSTPNLDPTTLGLRNTVAQQAQSLAGQDPNLSGYRAEGLGNINAQGKAQQNVLGQTLAARGLSYSPLASAEQTDLSNQNFKQKTDFQNQIPLLKNQLLNQKLASISGAFRSLPYGQNSSGTQVISGNRVGGALAALLNNLMAKKPKPGAGSGAPGGVGSGGGSPQQGILQSLYPSLFGLPFPPYQNPDFPGQGSGTPDISSGVSQYDPNNIYGGYGGGTAGLDSPTIFDQNLPGAPPYDPNPTVFSGPFDQGGGYGFGTGYGDFGFGGGSGFAGGDAQMMDL